MEQVKILNNTAEHLANQFIDMMNNDIFPLYQLLIKREVETTNFYMILPDYGLPKVIFKNKEFLKNFIHLTKTYHYPRLVLENEDDDLKMIYKQWVIEEFGEEFYKPNYKGDLSYTVNNDVSNNVLKIEYINRSHGINWHFSIPEIENNVPFHIFLAISTGKKLPKEHPERATYMRFGNGYRRCKIVPIND
jgi:hypothetical protein